MNWVSSRNMYNLILLALFSAQYLQSHIVGSFSSRNMYNLILLALFLRAICTISYCWFFFPRNIYNLILLALFQGSIRPFIIMRSSPAWRQKIKSGMRWWFNYLVNFYFMYFILHVEELSFCFQLFSFNPLQPGVAFLWPLKTSENLKVFWGFQEV